MLRAKITEKIKGILGNWARFSLVLAFAPFVLFPSLVASAHTVAELTKAPAAFDQQGVNVIGEVANVVTRYGEKPYTTFDLLNKKDNPLPIFVWGKPTFKRGDICHVTGKFVMEETLGTHVLARGVEAEKVEKVSEAEGRKVGTIFQKKKRYELRGAGGLYLPSE